MSFFDAYWTFVVFVYGASLGSFLNVCVYRIPEEMSVVRPRSRCPKCGFDIPWHDNVPILGWLMLGGKCRNCKERISVRYPAVELLTALLFVGIWLRYPYDARAAAYGLLTFGLLLATFVDLDHMWIPDRVSIGGMIVGPICCVLLPALQGQSGHLAGLLYSLLGLLTGFGLFWCIGFVGKLLLGKDAMGFGDVKLMGTLGAFLGPAAVFFVVFVASLLGTIVAMGSILAGRREWSARIPFGPYLAVAALIWVLGGNGWLDAYVDWATGGC